MRIARPITHTVVRPLTDPLVGSASFTPGQLFKSGEQGAWYDPSDLSTLFQDSLGTTPVTAVEQPVGLILDKRLPATSTAPLDALAFVPAGSTPPTAADTTFLSEACGSITFPANAGGYAVSRGVSATTHPIVIGRRYTHSYRIALSRALTGGETLVVYTTGTYGSVNFITLNSGTAGGAWIDFADATVIASANASGPNSCYVYAGTAIASPVTIYIRRYTVREVPGNHASQTTAAARSVLKKSGAYYYRQSDGVDDSAATTTGGGVSTAALIIMGFRTDAIGAAQTLFSDRSGNTGLKLEITAGGNIAFSGGNGASINTATGAAVAANTDYVVTAYYDGTNLSVQLNNGTATTAACALSAGTAAITFGKDNGAASGFRNGREYQTIYLKNVTKSAGEIASAKSYVAAKCGVTL